MKKINKNLTMTALVVFFVLGFVGPVAAFAAGPAPVDLLTAGNFVILSKTGVTNTGSHTSAIIGNMGSSPITAAAMNGVFCSEINGLIYGVDAAYTGSGATTCFAGNPGVPAVVPPDANKTLVDNAVLDMGTAYTDAAGRTLPDGTELYAGNLGGQTFAPGLYKWSTNVTIPTNVTLSGGPNDVWIFQIAGDLSIASGGSVPAGVKVVLTGGARASNVFWQVGGLTGATLGTYSTFNGNILSAKQVIIQTGAVLNGRALAQTQVTLDAGVVTVPTIPAIVAAQPAAATSGGYVRYIPLIGLLTVPNPLALTTGPGSVTYNYTVWNVAAIQPITGVSLTDDKCSPVTYVSGDLNNDGRLDPTEKWKYSCTTNLSKTTTNTSVATGHSNDGFNEVTVATEITTVVVSSTPSVPATAVVAPLINVVKVPSRLTPLPAGGGNVMYTYAVTNPGLVSMSNVTLTDDKCSTVSGPYGDANNNKLLDPGETWTYACGMYISASTRNIATAKGTANGLNAVGYAFSTVLVMAPGLPNTGLPPDGNSILWGALLLGGLIAIIFASRALVLKRHEN